MSNHIITKTRQFDSPLLKGVTETTSRCLNCDEVATVTDLASEKDRKSHFIWFEKQHKRCAEIWEEKQKAESAEQR